MVRSAAAVLAVLALPIVALGQEPQGTHTVVDGNTLWDLSQRFYSDPFEWRTIWNANRGVVEDPNWIYPDEVLVIPGLPADATMARPTQNQSESIAQLTPTASETPRTTQSVPADLEAFGLRQARPGTDEARTVFYDDGRDGRGSEMTPAAREFAPVSADLAHSAPWLIRLDEVPQSAGLIAGFARDGNENTTVRSFDRIRISMESPARVGAHLQLFKQDRTIPEIGHVMIPSGVATVEAIGDGEVVAIVSKEYHLIELGDMVRALPEYTPRPGVYAEDVGGGAEAMIMGFATSHVLTDIGHIAFLDLGANDGVTIGDEFVLYGKALPTDQEGTLQVIHVTDRMASARVTSMADNVFRQGVVVQLAKKMR